MAINWSACKLAPPMSAPDDNRYAVIDTYTIDDRLGQSPRFSGHGVHLPVTYNEFLSHIRSPISC